ncbi:unnamed protein product, partial [Porites evermanni]
LKFTEQRLLSRLLVKLISAKLIPVRLFKYSVRSQIEWPFETLHTGRRRDLSQEGAMKGDPLAMPRYSVTKSLLINSL